VGAQGLKLVSTIGPWRVTRRDVLKWSGLLLAGVAEGPRFAQAAELVPDPELLFGIVADPHFADADPKGSRYYRESKPKLAECVSLMNRLKVDFLVELGDLKDQGDPPREADTLAYLTTIERVLAHFKGPRYHVLGNHDLDSISKQQFLDRVENTSVDRGSSFFSFDARGAHFVVLDACFTADGSPYDHGNYNWKDANIPAAQCDWLARDLAATDRPTMVFVHQLLDGETAHCIKNASQVRQILEKSQKVLAVFHGHNHAGHYSQIEGIHYYTLKGMIEGSGEENSSYATVALYADHSIEVTGYRKAVGMKMEKA
jgi:predicted phosphodiesterase